METSSQSEIVKILSWGLLILWVFLSVWLLVFNAHDLRFSEHGAITFWGFLSPLLLVVTLLELKADLNPILALTGYGITGAYLYWFAVPLIAIFSVISVLVVAGVLIYIVNSNPERGRLKYIADHYGELLMAFMALAVVFGMFIIPFMSIAT